MSTAAVSSSSLYQELQTFYQDRKTDLTQLGQALQAGDLTDAQTAYNALTTLGQSGPFTNSEPFHNTQREQDFTAIGQALQSGDLAGAQQAFASLESTFHKQQAAASTSPLPAQSVDNPIILNISIPGAGTSPSPTLYANPGVLTPASPVATSPATSTSSTTNVSPAAIVNPGDSAVPEIILNLGSAGGTGGGGPEEVTITLGNNPSGSGEQLTVGVNNGQGGQEQQIAINLNNTANEQIVLNLLNAAASSQSQGNSISVQA
jgi:hypothetical protein